MEGWSTRTVAQLLCDIQNTHQHIAMHLLLCPIVAPEFRWEEWQPGIFDQLRVARPNMDSTDQFEAIVSEQYEALFRFAMSLTRSESDARDLTQQTFYIWATRGHQLRDVSKVKAWLFTTLHRVFLVARRKQSRFPHHDLEAVSDE